MGTYMPHVKGADFVVVHSRRKPQNKIDGALRCARTSQQRRLTFAVPIVVSR